MPVAEDVLQYLVGRLAAIPASTERHRFVATRYAHIYLPDLVFPFWRSHSGVHTYQDLTEEQFTVFYDAAWELARIGVIRPGRLAPRGMEMAMDFGDLWSITEVGFKWLADAAKRPFIDTSGIAEILAGFAGRFGPGYAQRAVEAVKSYRTVNYLAACSMVGAAAESILLALAIAKSGDEAKVMADYHTSRGRSRVTGALLGNVGNSTRRQFEAAMHVLGYWRDDASHGAYTTITEVEAHAALSELLRLAQFSSDHWDELTA